MAAVMRWPTARHEIGDMQATDSSAPSMAGLWTTDQEVPSHSSSKLRVPREASVVEPTATHLIGEVQAIDWSTLWSPPTLALGTTDQAVPFHDSTRLC